MKNVDIAIRSPRLLDSSKHVQVSIYFIAKQLLLRSTFSSLVLNKVVRSCTCEKKTQPSVRDDPRAAAEGQKIYI